MNGGRVVHDDARLLLPAAGEARAAKTEAAARFHRLAKVGVEPAVDERVVADGGHGEPVADEERGRVVARHRHGSAHVAHQVVHVEREPAQREQRNHH